MSDSPSTVLIIDDDPDLRWVVRQICNGIGFRVEEASSAGLGLDIVAKRLPTPDAVLLDMRLPDFGGDEVLKRLKHLDRHLPVKC